MTTTEDQRLRVALGTVAGKSKRQIAQELQLSLSTVYRLNHDPLYVNLVEGFRGELIEQALGELVNGSIEAAKVLREIATDKTQKAGSRVAAAKALLSETYKLSENHELRLQIERLRTQISEKEQQYYAEALTEGKRARQMGHENQTVSSIQGESDDNIKQD
ncbi:MAG: helix-turn-helix domain-containing protein [Planctomycetota bacterium]